MADIYSIKLVDSKTIAASGSYTSTTVPVNAYKALGNFGTQILVAGAGTVTVTLYTSKNDGASFVAESTELWTSQAAGEASASHGFSVCTHFYVVVEVTGGAGTTVDLWMCIQ